MNGKNNDDSNDAMTMNEGPDEERDGASKRERGRHY